jgi:hypothetical protein
MLRWLTEALFGTEDQGPHLKRGDRVRKIDDELVGTISSWVARDGVEHARVVYCGQRATWVELVDVGLLRPA